MDDRIIKFYLNKFDYLSNFDEIDISMLAPNLRRRMSLLDKVCISLLSKNFSDNIQNIIYSSQFGEVERLLKIIEQYSTFKEVSPSLFSASVHNYPVGLFLYNIKKPIPYSALSGADNTISSGLLTSLISVYENTLFCYCDANDNKICAMALNISKKMSDNSIGYRIILKNSNVKDNFENYIKLFNNEVSLIETPLYIIERMV